MDRTWLLDNWALVAAAIVICTLLCLAAARWLAGTARWQLRDATRLLRQKRRILRRACASVAAAEQRTLRLQKHVERAKPRHLNEAREALADTRALAKIAHDQVLIAENHLRRIIVEEFPPARQASLRTKYRVADAPDRKPFTF